VDTLYTIGFREVSLSGLSSIKNFKIRRLEILHIVWWGILF